MSTRKTFKSIVDAINSQEGFTERQGRFKIGAYGVDAENERHQVLILIENLIYVGRDSVQITTPEQTAREVIGLLARKQKR
ncbi:hypothetical protein [Thalassobacillus pellis]|uniref:hypothetical protein n=1 Tax=Thalassobacillus pellis TaxID=748008 RepID=UPI0019615DEF|nr:hypothetical protein [Thalassobacillus pellis]MBM7554546.1 hypothetical protein [Thalassobacillus pellis]